LRHWVAPDSSPFDSRAATLLFAASPFAQLVVPDHRELDRGTLRAILRQAGLSVEEFLKLL
jgi:hypothetical protein